MDLQVRSGVIEVDLRKFIPGDRLRYRNCLDIPAVFGVPITITPGLNSVNILIQSSEDDIKDYVCRHYRSSHQSSFLGGLI